ncbi:MAG: hypothetical protein D6760_02040 [Deltaproteobacteria bacterium]|nr:MAG: hypothetical protein D6760_02040 [Deltaproteobacteria bacterium]
MRSGRNASTAVALASILFFTAAPAGAVNDVDIREQTGDVIARVAEAAQGLRFGKHLPGDVEVTSDRMTFDYKRGTLVYTGHVRVLHKDIRLRSDRIDVVFEPGRTDSLRSITATGHVEVVRGDETATGNTAVYDPGRATLTLSGNARLGSGRHRVEGQRVVVYLDEGRAVVEGGGGPVRARISPRTSEVEDLLE